MNTHNTFAFELFNEISKIQSDNIILTPYSTSSALAMAYIGSRGKTRKQISQVFGWLLDPKSASQGMLDLRKNLRTLNTIEGIELNIASGIWVDDSLRLLEDFIEQSKKYYATSLNSVDFQKSTDTARRTINQWVEQETNGTIPALIPPGSLNALTRVLLVTATHYQGLWASPFQKSKTQQSQFWLYSTQSTSVSFMTQQHQFPYADTHTMQVLELPYVGNRLSMIFFLPKQGEGLSRQENPFTNSKFEQLIASLKPQNVKASIPRLHLSVGVDLRQTLSLLGMPLAFDQQADFSGLSDSEDVHLAAVFHQSFLEVNEEGTEAAGSTGVVMEGRSLQAPQPVVFRADHPFFFVIRENQTGIILFLGKVSDPTASSSSLE
ncbi:MAG: serine/threonine protein kinase [Nitrospirales bacterium]|nr:MAG: serine/threonine protein kinase [Nitrospirales bacterium]